MTRQREAFVVLLNNMDKYNELVEVSADSTGNAAKKYQSYEEQLEASKNRIQAAWESLANNKELQSSLTTINNILAELIKALPYVIKYGVRFLAIMNAHKLPSALKGLGGYLIPGGAKNFASTFKTDWNSASGFWGKAGVAFRDTIGYNPALADKDNAGDRGFRTPSMFKGVQSATEKNTQALIDNTNALKSKKEGTAGGINKPGASVIERSTIDKQIADQNDLKWRTTPLYGQPQNKEVQKQQDIQAQIDAINTADAAGRKQKSALKASLAAQDKFGNFVYSKDFKDSNGVLHKKGEFATVDSETLDVTRISDEERQQKIDAQKAQIKQEIKQIDQTRAEKKAELKQLQDQREAQGKKVDNVSYYQSNLKKYNSGLNKDVASKYFDSYIKDTPYKTKFVDKNGVVHNKGDSNLRYAKDYVDANGKRHKAGSKIGASDEIMMYKNGTAQISPNELDRRTVDTLGAQYTKRYGKNFNENDYITNTPYKSNYTDKNGVVHHKGDMNLKYAKDFTDSNGTVHKKGTKIQETDEIMTYKNAKNNQQINNSESSKKAASKGAGIAQAAIQGVSGAVTGYMTASTTSKVNTGKKDADGNDIYAEYEMDSSTSHWSKGTTALVQGLGSMISPVLGQLLGIAMDALWSRVLGPWFEADKVAMKERVESANNMLTAINGTKDTTEKLNTIAKEGIQTIDDQTDWDDAIQDLLKSISGTDDDTTAARKLITKYLKKNLDLTDYGIDQNADLYTIVGQMQDNQEEQIALTQALLIAEKQASHDELVASKEEDISKIYQQANNATTKYNDDLEAKANAAGWGAAGASIGVGALAGMGIGAAAGEGIGAIPGLIIGAVIGGVAGIGTGIAAHDAVMEQSLGKSFSMTARIDYLQDMLEAEYSKGDDADQELIAETQEILEETKACKAQLDAIYKEIDVDAMEVAASKAYYDSNGNGTQDDNESYLSNMSDEALKSLGLDKIKEIIIDQYIADNGSTGYYDLTEGGEYSDWVNSIFASALKSSDLSNINDLFTGKAYTLSEALQLPGQGEGGYTDQILSNFMNATGATNIEDLQKLAETFGDIKLSDWLLSGTEMTEKLQTINDIVSDLASDSKTISEKENTIISQYPQLIKYLGNTKALMTELVTLSNKYAAIDISSKFNDISSSKDAYSDLLSGMKSDATIGSDVSALLADSGSGFGDITDIGTLIEWLAKNGYSDGVGQAIYQYVLSYFGDAELTSDTQKSNINTVIEYQKSLLDDELDNLNEQKEAMESINEQREYENKLIEARLKLESAQTEKKRVYRAGVGWTYEADQSAILEAQENLESVENEKAESALDAQIAEIEKQKEDLERIQNAKSLEYQKDLYDAYTSAWGSTNMADFETDITTALGGVSQKITELIETETAAQTKERNDAISNLETIWNGDGSEGVSGMSLGELQSKVANGTATEEEQAEYDTRARSFQSSYNEAVNNNLISSDDFSNGTFSFNGNTDNAQAIATNSESALGDSYINNDEAKEYYYLFSGNSKGWWEHSKYKKNTKYMIKLPESSTNVTSDEEEGIFNDGDVYRVFDGTSNGKYKSTEGTKIKDEAKRWGSVDGIPDGLYFTYHGSDHYFAVKDGKFYPIKESDTKTISDDDYSKLGGTPQLVDSRTLNKRNPDWLENNWKAEGTEDLVPVGVNELGTEAIVTPSGTITALPSHTGIVPADITKNLWELGEVAPSIMRTMTTQFLPDTLQQHSMTTNNDDSLNVTTLNVTLDTNGEFDVDDFISQLKSRVALTRHSSK